ncbi:MAG: PIN domain-containing protein [Sulfuritalea sp.]|nr:PIN domain-containing protein [Sulfuritalea sp.]MBK8762134.1 PIN domain-containing protein [Sulfuritalea sp.]MBK9350018.1 PIN domain-containing protein [Sulfuritalea sp.]MBP6636740.1 PIN domain-containing protein [Sulfuritalea sp.]MBP7422671.1 PIN domain-containing protein [Sulfuritalea sp.]
MIAVDTNLLVYAHREDSPFHQRAAACVAGLAEDRATWAIPWPCLHEFFAIVTHPRIYAPPTPRERALDQIDAWLESPSLMLLAESESHWSELRSLISVAQLAGAQVHDARIAALCLQHGVQTLWSADRDFGRFPKLSVANPLIA